MLEHQHLPIILAKEKKDHCGSWTCYVNLGNTSLSRKPKLAVKSVDIAVYNVTDDDDDDRCYVFLINI